LLTGAGRDWWFASTAIPLLAATVGPLANVLSIAALVTSWRAVYDPDYPGVDFYAVGIADPRW
jgi:potassium channel subfamily K